MILREIENSVKKSNELIKKIEGLASRYEASQLHRQVYVAQRVKTMNESIYYNVDAIHAAIAAVGAHILDAGCGSGRDSKVFLEKGFTVTAMDASERMCKEAAKLLGQEVLQRTFQEMDFQNEFDGIWACASLLHVARREIDFVLQNLGKALKYNGVLYLSFKYGNEERMDQERFFNDYNENSLRVLLENNGFTVMDIFATEDVRKDRVEEMWVNAFAEKRHEMEVMYVQ